MYQFINAYKVTQVVMEESNYANEIKLKYRNIEIFKGSDSDEFMIYSDDQ